MKATIQFIISNKLITTVFQPIFDIERETIIGYEALTRGKKNSDLYSPEALFKAAEQHNLLAELDLLCREKAITRFVELKLSGKLFINICLKVMLDKDHPYDETIKLVKKSGLSPQQVVLEISEKSPFPNNNSLQTALNKYRQFGFDIAIDDLGVGYSGLKQWSSLRPEIVKIDRYFIDQCDQDMMKREFLKILFELGRISNAQVIAEGIETRAEFELLRELGMVYAQGYFLARPTEIPRSDYPKLDISAKPEEDYRLGTIALLAEKTVTIDFTQNADDAYYIFSNNPKVDAIPVLDGVKPIGMVYRNELMESYSDIYGRALFSKKSACDIMSNQPMIIEHLMPLEQVSALLTARENSEFTQASIVVEGGKYLGIVSPRDLLKSITDSKLEQARYANPLTGLPGNVLIEKEIDDMLSKQQSFYLAYLDLNHFKPFNDIYGYANGDLLLKTLANCVMLNTNNKNCFVGHIGGDDFIVMFKKNNFEQICHAILKEFAEQSLSFISKEHQQQLGYYAINRSGEKVFNPLVSLAIGVIKLDKASNHSYHQIADLASKAKSEAKKLNGNSLFICRRSNIDNSFIYSEKNNSNAA
ncbi:MAG: GGDEF domain-containing protein [Colwellia sp.]|nr:GGDEF domain-containing protein [Colwellia sp.]